ncbi:MAG TPA: IPT/TIG domain-containing protein [Acidimicrobiales bacterium]|nr:IPT/TIG domain-containing protein [Acidimicrobiales bacterium]
MAITGDVACGTDDPNFNGGAGTTSYCQMAATANEVKAMAPQYLAIAGDTQYDYDATQGVVPPLSYFQTSYGQSWGNLASTHGGPVPNANIHPVPGNQEYGDVNDNNVGTGYPSTYFQNFGPSGLNELPSSVTGPTSDWYSYNVAVNAGTWHVIALDSECAAVGGCGYGSPEESWLRSDLTANAGKCILAYWHEPRWSDGPLGDQPDYAALWQDAVAARVTAVVNGHDHNYEHFGPMGPNGMAAAGGTSEFVVGSGGVNLTGTVVTASNALAAQDASDFGVLKLTLHSTSLDYGFQTVAGKTPDTGTVGCANTAGAVPSVASVAPVSGSGSGGTPVTITGSGFAAGDTVTFGTRPATSVTVGSATSTTATAPAGSGTVDVVVHSPAGYSAMGSGDEFTYTSSLKGYSATLAASTTSPAPGSSAILTATANQDVGPTPYGISIVDASNGVVLAHTGSGTTLSTTVSQPAGAAQQRYVAQIDSQGYPPVEAVSAPKVVTWACPSGGCGPVPAVNGVSPISGPYAGGTNVTITGANFAGGDTVSFGATAGTAVTVVSATSATATAPAGSGTVDVTVKGPGGISATGVADEYTYTESLQGYAVALSASTTSPATGATVKLTATANQDVGPSPYGMSIYDASTGAQLVHVTSGTSVSVTASQPPGATQQRYVAQIDNAPGTPVVAVSTPVVVTWGCSGSCGGAVPTVSAVSPISGSYTGGTPVTVTGTSFAAGDAVDFGAVASSSVTLASSASLTATAPAGTGTVDVVVVGPGGPSATSVADEFTYTESLNGYAVSLASSTTAPATGTSVTLTATANQDVGSTPYGLSIVDASTGAVVVHVGTGSTVSAKVAQPAGASQQRYVAQIDSQGGPPIEAVSSPVVVTWGGSGPGTGSTVPTVTSVSPISGPYTGGTKVTVAGASFASGDAVSFGANPAMAVTVVSATSITATAPAGSGTVDVSVSGSGGASSAIVADEYTYTEALQGYSVSLAASTTTPLTGAAVTLTAAANQDVGPTPYGMSIYDASTGAQLVHVTSGTSVSVTASQPPGATQQRYVAQIDNAGGSPVVAASSPVVVTWSCASGCAGGSPSVSAVSPQSGPNTGDTAVTVTGANFASGDTVKFGTAAGTSVTVVSPTSITVTAPAGSGGTVDVSVSSPSGPSPAVVGDEYTYTESLNGFSVTLAASTTSPAPGATVTLTATANQDVGPTAYGMSIVDASTGALVVHTGSGSTVSATVIQPSGVTQQRYVAQIDTQGGPPLTAVSSPVVVTW